MPAVRRPSPTSSSSTADNSSGSSSQCTIVKEGHGHPIYCVAFSRHLYASSSSDDDNDGNAATSAIFATCGGPYATIYEIKKCNTNPKNSSSSSSELSVCQIYHDVDDGEVYYTCAFGGRGVGMPLGGGRTATTTTPMKCSNGIVHFGTEQQQQQQLKLSDENQHYQRSIKRQSRENNDNRMNGGPPLLCLGGTRGIIKIIDTTQQSLQLTLSGHGNDITDLKFSPMNEYYLLSSSKDESIRLWNISSQGGGVNLAIFAGHVGHRGQVVSIGWHISGKQFVSGGMDNMIKLWNIGDDDTTTITTTSTKTNHDNSCSNRNTNNNNNTTTTTATPSTSNATDQSVIPSNWSNDMDGSCSSSRSSSSVRIPSTKIQQQQYSKRERDGRTTTFDTVFQQFPYFSTNKVHTNYVDCVQFIGDLILSKSAVSNVIVLWKPVVVTTSINEKAVYTTTRTIPSNIIFLREFQLDNCSSWYIRFECPGPDYTILACGNECGEVRVWQIDDESELLENDVIDDNYKDDNKHSCSLTTSITLSSITGDRDNLSTVRMVAFNPYGSQLVAVKDDSTIWMWDSLG